MSNYPVILTPDDNGTVIATCKDFPEVTTFGDDNEDALSRAVDAVEEAIAARIAKRETVPTPGKGRHYICLPTQTALKVLLYQAMQGRGVTKADMVRKLGCHAPQVDRLLDIHHASRPDHLDQAMAALDQHFIVDAVQL